MNFMTRRLTPIALALTAALTAALALVSTAALAQYRWVDENGRTVFSDKPPPKNAKNAKRISVNGGAETDLLPGSGNLPYEVRLNMRDHPVTLYTNGAECAGCGEARQLLSKRGIPFTEKTVVSDFDLVAFQKVNPGSVLPSVTVGATMISGFNPAAINNSLDAAGYPANSRLPATYKNPPAVRTNPDNTPVPPSPSPNPGAPAAK